MAKPLFQIPDEVNKNNIGEALQQAVELELATIPTYLYTYYSINRAWSTKIPTSGRSKLTPRQKLVKAIEADLKRGEKNKAESLALKIQIYANKAAAVIMSVVVEEMLHLALVSNVKQAIIGPPLIFGKSPVYTAHLPGHTPEFPINLSKLTKNQLVTFLKIESPKPFTEGGPDTDRKALHYKTIGEFYAIIEECVLNSFPGSYDNDRPQLVPGKNYYGQNNTDTLYYNEAHEPQFTNADDSGDLVHVVDCTSALKAMEEIVEQGEGHEKGDHLDKQGNPILKPKGYWDDKSKINPDDFVGPSKEELSHFDRFLELYCEGYYLDQEFRELLTEKAIKAYDPKGDDYCFFHYFVFDQPANPLTKKRGRRVTYDGNLYLQKVSNLANAMYSYLLLMVESCYYQKGNTQFEVFMFGIHKSMIWLVSGFGNGVRSVEFKASNDKKYNAAMTFENYPFNKKTSPKAQLIALAEDLKDYCAPINKKLPKNKQLADYSWMLGPKYFPALPDVSLNHDVKQKPIMPTIR